MNGQRTVKIVRHVVFTRPHQLDRLVDSLGNLGRLDDEVDVDAPTKTATQEGGAQGYIFRLETHRLGNGTLGGILPLCWPDQGHLAVFVPGGEVHRLQRRMRDVLAHVFGPHHILRCTNHGIRITHCLQREGGT